MVRYRAVFNTKRKLNKYGTALIQIEAYSRGKRVYFSTGVYVRPEQWNDKRRMIVKHPNAHDLNMIVMDKANLIEKVAIEMWKNGKEESLSYLKMRMSDKSNLCTKDSLFSKYMREAIWHGNIKDSTKKNRLTTLEHIEKFRPKLTFDDIDNKLIADFAEWLGQKGLGQNSIIKHIQQVMIYVNRALEDGLIRKRVSLSACKLRKEPSHHSCLTPVELSQLQDYETTLMKNCDCKHKIVEILRAFLFSCYTGLRYSDIIRIKREDIETITPYCWLNFKSYKTGTLTKLPLKILFEGKAMTMLVHCTNSSELLFDIPSNQYIDKVLDRIVRDAGICKHVTFHSARHTFATILIHTNVSITTIQKLLGHKNIRTTSIYCEVLEDTIVRELKQAKLNYKD